MKLSQHPRLMISTDQLDRLLYKMQTCDSRMYDNIEVDIITEGDPEPGISRTPVVVTGRIESVEPVLSLSFEESEFAVF